MPRVGDHRAIRIVNIGPSLRQNALRSHQPPDVIGADEEAFYSRYREISGLSEEQVNPTTTDYFLLLASATVFVPVTEQLAALDKGETTGIQVAYMSPAVSGMHDVFYRALKRHQAASGGAK